MNAVTREMGSGMRVTGRIAVGAMVASALTLPMAGGSVASAVPAGVELAPGCDGERRTVVFTDAGVVSQEGSWHPCVVDTGMTTGESGLAIAGDGTLLRSVASNPNGIAVSSDEGATWERRLLPEETGTAIADGWMDPDTGRYFYSESGDTPVRITDDQGLTWRDGTFDSANRHDWNRVWSGRPVELRADGYPNNIYYCNWINPLGAISQTDCFRSVDGGETFQKVGETIVAGACEDPSVLPKVYHGRGLVDPSDGTLYLPAHMCGKLVVLVSPDEGVTWERFPIEASAQPSFGPVTNIPRAVNEPFLFQTASGQVNPIPAEFSMSIQSDALRLGPDGRLHAIWIDHQSFLPFLASSADGGRTWSEPVVVSPPDVGKGILPSLDIDETGRLGFSFHGSLDDGATWTGYLGVADERGGVMTIESAPVTPPGEPLMDQPCCWANGLQEYSAARWAPDGTLYAALQASNPALFPSNLQDSGSGVVGRLVAAPAVPTTPRPGGATNPDAGVSDSTGGGSLAATGGTTDLTLAAALAAAALILVAARRPGRR